MGVGLPPQILEGIAHGIDLFDCVLPTRMGRRGHLFTRDGVVRITSKAFERSDAPLDAECDCEVCATQSASDWEIVFLNEVTERLRQTAPHVIVETSGGYPPVQAPPESVVPHPDLRIVFAHWGRGYQSGYDDPAYGRKAEFDNPDAWTHENVDETLSKYFADKQPIADSFIVPPM